jgi:bifunctional non-homologous end joining protein LigD
VVEACANLCCKAALIDGEVVVQDEQGISDFEALRSAVHKAPHRIVFFAFDLLHLDGQDLRRTPLIERRAALRTLIELDPRSPIQFSDHVDCDGAKFFKAAAELGLEGIVSKRATSLYRGGPSRNWLKSKNMVEGEFILLGTERDSDGEPWALLASDRDGRLEFCRPGYPEPATGAQSGLGRTDGRIGDCQAAAARVEARLGSVLPARAAGAGKASQG